MGIQKRALFKNLDARAWQNLILVALVTFYLLQTILNVAHDGLFFMTGDYLAFWSIGHIANMQTYADVYDLETLSKAQASVMYPDGTTDYTPTPAPFLPIFILPFQVLALLSPQWSFLTWIAINLLVFILYLRFFINSLISKDRRSKLLFLFLLSFPVYWNLLWGQANVWLLICVGEFIRTIIKNKPFQAGLCLAGLLLKPQILVLAGLALLIQQAWKTLAGFMSASAIIFSVSLIMAGFNGLLQLFGLWLGYATGLPTNSPENMVNWRMIGIRLASLTSPTIGWGIALAGMVLSLWLVFSLWHYPLFESSPQHAFVLLGTMAATVILAWHAHVHMEMILIPSLIYLYSNGNLPDKLLNSWLFIPVASALLGLLLVSALISAGVIEQFTQVGVFFVALSTFGVNLYILLWSRKKAFFLDPKVEHVPTLV